MFVVRGNRICWHNWVWWILTEYPTTPYESYSIRNDLFGTPREKRTKMLIIKISATVVDPKFICKFRYCTLSDIIPKFIYLSKRLLHPLTLLQTIYYSRLPRLSFKLRKRYKFFDNTLSQKTSFILNIFHSF